MVKPERKPAIDPSVAAVLSHSERKVEEAHQTKEQKQKTLKERKKMQKRVRVVLDLPKDQIAEIKTLAEQNETTASQLAKLAIHLLLRGVESGRIDLHDYLMIHEKRPRYGFLVKLEDEEE